MTTKIEDDYYARGETPKLYRIQKDLQVWRDKNFPDHTLEQQFIGMVEETGELGHAILKYQQAIRGMTYDMYKAEVEDAIGDICIFMMGFCDHFHMDLYAVINKVAAHVMKRDWLTHKEDGGDSTRENQTSQEEGQNQEKK